MQIIELEQDIKVLCVKAERFPEGIMEAHQKIEDLIPVTYDRTYFGLSRPEQGKIGYWAGTAQKEPNEAKKWGISEMLTIPAGRYQSIVIKDFKKDITQIKKAFMELLQLPNLSPNGYCVEQVIEGKDVQCMVILD